MRTGVVAELLPGLDDEVAHVAVGAGEAEPPEAGPVPAHDGDVAVDALDVNAVVGRHLVARQVLPRHLHVRERVLLQPREGFLREYTSFLFVPKHSTVVKRK